MSTERGSLEITRERWAARYCESYATSALHHYRPGVRCKGLEPHKEASYRQFA